MKELEQLKLKEEIKSIKINRLSDIIKGIALLMGSIVLFIAIQRPESILNRRLSQETISRERAKLVFELTQGNEDYEEIVLGLSIIEKAYPEENNQWIKGVRDIYDTKLKQIQNKSYINELDSINQSKIIGLRTQLQSLYEERQELQVQYVAEATGIGGTKTLGRGPAVKALEDMIENIDVRIRKLEAEIEKTETEQNQEE